MPFKIVKMRYRYVKNNGTIYSTAIGLSHMHANIRSGIIPVSNYVALSSEFTMVDCICNDI